MVNKITSVIIAIVAVVMLYMGENSCCLEAVHSMR